MGFGVRLRLRVRVERRHLEMREDVLDRSVQADNVRMETPIFVLETVAHAFRRDAVDPETLAARTSCVAALEAVALDFEFAAC